MSKFFRDHARATLADIRLQGRYREFAALEKQAVGYPYYRAADGRRILVWSANDYLAMGGHPVPVDAACAAALARLLPRSVRAVEPAAGGVSR